MRQVDTKEEKVVSSGITLGGVFFEVSEASLALVAVQLEQLRIFRLMEEHLEKLVEGLM
jgi:hypothetical protein